MRFFPTSAALLSIFVASASAQPVSRLVWQPVQEYFIRIQPGRAQMPVEGTQRLNSFVSYTHLGTDFGFHGPAEHTIQWQSDEICVHLGQDPDSWAGLWHSLAGLARESSEVMDFEAPWPVFITAKYQPKVVSVMLQAKGQGRLKLEIKSNTQEMLWSEVLTVDKPECETYILPVPSMAIRNAKLINWTAESGSEVCVDNLNLGVELPAIPFDEYVVAACYAKLARCYDASSGFVRDRAHTEAGAFESVSSTGMFALMTAAVSRPPLSMVSQKDASKIIRTIHKAVRSLDHPYGLLPHFVRRTATGYAIHPGTEFSSVDTAIYYHGLLLAAETLHDEDLKMELLSAVDQIDFKSLHLTDGSISHGLKDDGRSILPHGWNDWGGESALVKMLERIVNDHTPQVKMERPGQAWQGTGFIPEIQSLFYPDFDRDEPDSLDGVKWRSARVRMLEAQRQYIQRTWPQSLPARLGIYGLSAGEGEHGDRYQVGGVDLPDQAMIHPHYILMSASLTQPAETYALLERMEKAGYFPPWGLVETISITGHSYLPMNGSLNAAFEALGAYHLFAKSRGIPDAIYEASRQSPELRRAVELFFPPTARPIQSAELRGAPGTP
ncbi:hypothetical protein SAMN02745166_01703 [Prosthecobacter debontii]|uniref:Uncharacterized protein n=1 Tax=Prosthecobacter debontii TaxID=48467 RepID=A0A1T4XLK0_9BACT|nr:hypothetical protein [Prosthecobacter debontii]SKA90440.1 hypothetical protein SAMN02745166_01703 [Prosthecobacter debontii]